MPTSDIDRSLQPNADQIRRRDFATVRRGYDPGQVREYLDSVAQRMEFLDQEMRAAKYTADTAAKRAASAVPAPPQTDPYDAVAKKFAGLIGSADKEANRLLEEARGESHRIVEEARAQSERTRADAQARDEQARTDSERVLEQARQEADRVFSAMAERRRQLADRLQAMQAHLTSAAQELDVPVQQGVDESRATEAAPEQALGEQEQAKTNADSLFDAGTSESSPEPDAEPPPYEDLWVAREDAVDIPDLASIELDFDDDRPSADR